MLPFSRFPCADAHIGNAVAHARHATIISVPASLRIPEVAPTLSGVTFDSCYTNLKLHRPYTARIPIDHYSKRSVRVRAAERICSLSVASQLWKFLTPCDDLTFLAVPDPRFEV